jgi:hypothetical protein
MAAQITTNHTSSQISAPAWQDAPILQMPLDIIPQIFMHLIGSEIGTVTLVCKDWYLKLNENDSIWSVFLSRHFPGISPNVTVNFKNCYRTFYSNFINTVYASHTLQGHQNSICGLSSMDGKLVSSSFDKTIKIWDLSTGKRIATLKGHAGAVFCLSSMEGKLVSGSRDKTIKIWDLSTGKCIATLEGHEGPVSCLSSMDGKLVSGSYDKTIKTWDLSTGKCIATLKGHAGSVFCLSSVEGKLVSGSADGIIKIWDFTADDAMVFQELAKLLKSEKSENQIEHILERFSRMPKTAKNAIYGKLYEICKPFANDYWGCAEDAFYDQNGQSSTPFQKAQAIIDYLNDESLHH